MAPPIRRTVARSSANAIAFAELCLALNTFAYSKAELGRIIGVSDGTLKKWLDYLHKRKLVHICEYRHDNKYGPHTAIWTWGVELRDVPKPRVKTHSERQLEYIKRKQLRTLHELGNQFSAVSS